MQVTFSVVGGRKFPLDISEGELASTTKHRLSDILGKPASAIKLIHNAKILSDDFPISSVLSSQRTSICVKIDQPQRMKIKIKPEARESSSPNNNRLGEVGTLLRNFILENPSAIPQLVAAVSDAFPDTNEALSSNPELLLGVVGITPEELTQAVEAQESASRQNILNFISGMTPDDFSALQQISTALPDTPLESIIRAFTSHGRNIQATISYLSSL